ncbi:MAG: type IV pilus biogenesis/stability protein PilW [Methyloprofundus sp.]|nr:type IV pilus biogenesis/stability protein PilW [Methyloprofundus sp.]
MKIKRIYGLLLSMSLMSACSMFTTVEEGNVVYVPEMEKVELDRPAVDRAKTLSDLGIAYYRLGKYTYALENLQRSLVLDPNNAVSYQFMALIKERSHQPAEAQAYFAKAMALAPDNYDIVSSYGVFLYQQGRLDEALVEFKRAADAPFYDKKWVAYSYMGYYDVKAQRKLQAEKRFFYALKANPKYPPALLEMSRLKYAKAELMSARAFVERYFAVAGKTLEGLQLAIQIERALQNNELAEEYQLELSREYPFAR